jgi:WD40 repeat protein
MFLAVTIAPTVMAGEPGPKLKLLATLEGGRPSAYKDIAFSPDGKMLASSDLFIKENGESVRSVKLWDVDQRKVIATFQGGDGLGDGGRLAVAFSPDSKTLAVSGTELTLWDVAAKKEKATFKGRVVARKPGDTEYVVPGGLGLVAFSPDWRMFASVDDKTVRLGEVATGKERAALQGHTGVIFSMAFSPDGKLLACGTGTSASNGQPAGGEVKLWDLTTGQQRASLKGVVKLRLMPKSMSYLRSQGVPETVLKPLAALRDKEFATEDDFEKEFLKIFDKVLDKDKRAEYLDLVGQQIQPSHEGAMVWVWSLAFSPDGKRLASADVYGNVFLWDVQSGKRTVTLQAFNPEGKEEDINPALCVAFSPDGNLLAAGTVRGIKLWDVKSGKEVGGPNHPAATVWSVAFRPDGKMLASAGSKRVIGQKDRVDDEPTIRLWELLPAKKAAK